MDGMNKNHTQALDPLVESPPNSEVVQKTPSRTQGRIAKRKLHQGGGSEDSPLSEKSIKKRRRSSSTSSMSSPTTLLKPALTERQQLALLLQLTGPQKQQGKSPLVETSPRDTPTPGRSKVNKRNELGETPLHVACIKGDSAAVLSLLDQGADIDTCDNAGWTPLHEACNHGHIDIVSILVDRGVNIHAVGMEGDTPLHDAVVNNHREVVELLLSKGADPKIQNSHNQTSLDICRDESIQKLLKIALSVEGELNERDVFADVGTPNKQKLSTPPPLQHKSTTFSLKKEFIRRAETPPPRLGTHARLKFGGVHAGRRVKVDSRGSFYSDLSSSESDSDGVDHNGRISTKPTEAMVTKERLGEEKSISMVISNADPSARTEETEESTEHKANSMLVEENLHPSSSDDAEVIGSPPKNNNERTLDSNDKMTPLLETSLTNIEASKPDDEYNDVTVPQSPLVVSFQLSAINTNQQLESVTTNNDQVIPETSSTTVDCQADEELKVQQKNDSPIPPSLPPISSSVPVSPTSVIVSPCSNKSPTVLSPSSPKCSLSIMSGKPRRVASIDGDENSLNEETTPVSFSKDADKLHVFNDDEEDNDSVSTVVSFPTSLPIVFGSLPPSSLCSVSSSCSPKRTNSLSPTFPSKGVNNMSEVTAIECENLLPKASTPVSEFSDTDSSKMKQEEILQPPPPKKLKKLPAVNQQEKNDLSETDFLLTEDSHDLPPKRRLSRQVMRSGIVQLRKNQSSKHTVTPPPHNYDSFLTSKRSYRSSYLPSPTFPKDVYPPLQLSQYKLFADQEQERMSLLASHVNEVDRLVVSFEQELTRAYQKASTVSYPPLSACAVLIERLNNMRHVPSSAAPHDRLRANLSTNSDASDNLLNSYVQDVWDKYHQCSEHLASRHKMEVEALWLSQKQQWMERNSNKESSHILSHVPVAHTGTFPSYVR